MAEIEGEVKLIRMKHNPEVLRRLRLLTAHWGIDQQDALAKAVMVAFDCIAHEIIASIAPDDPNKDDE